METIGDISVWLTPAIIIGLFLWLRADIRVLEGRFEKRFDGMEKCIDGLEERFEKRFDGVEKRFDGVEKRFDGVEKRFDGVEKRFEGMDERMRVLEAGQAEIRGQLSVICEYILRPNLWEPEGAPETAPGN